MPVNAISNDDFLDDVCNNCGCAGFSPAVNFAYDAGDAEIVVTDATTYGAGNSRKVVRVTIIDSKGLKVVQGIASGDGDNAITIDVDGYDSSEGFTIKATVVSMTGCISDGHAKIAAEGSGALGSWDKDALAMGFTDDES